MAINIYDIDYDKISKCKIEWNIVDISNYKINWINDEYLKLSTSDNFVIVLKKYNSYNIWDNIKNIINTENNFLLEYISNNDYWNLKKYSKMNMINLKIFQNVLLWIIIHNLILYFDE